ncbi:DUF6049 family protein [Glaciihabitans arcticus]|uniref:DUF6049 family protein n=1 Tax=Glaciihabitans arcticus TaxID=2668039 RepID=UPI0012AC2EC7|nr:DUF6049 family protein [Glaciihabitans arcticus]
MSVKPAIRAFAAAIGVVALVASAPVSANAAALAPASVVRVGVVVPLSVPGGLGGIIDLDTLAAYTAPGGLLTRELEAIIDTPVTIGIDPMIIASIRLLGSSAPESATQWLDRLAAASNDTFALSYADSDLTLGLQAGSGAVLEPTSFDFAIDSGLFAAVDPEATPDPNATADPGTAPPLPTSETLLDWDYTLGDVAWPQPATVTADDLATITASGYTSTVLSSGNVTAVAAGRAHLSVGGESVLVTDDALSAQLSATITATSTEAWQQQTIALSTALGAIPAPRDGDVASVVLGLDRGSFAPGSRLRATLLSLSVPQNLELVGLSDVLRDDAASTTLTDAPQTDVRVSLAKSMLTAEGLDASFATVAEDPALITGERRIRLLSALAPQWNRDPGTWGSEVDGYLADSASLRASVRVAASSDLVFPERGFVPVNIINNLEQPVTVIITVKPLTPLLNVEDANFELTIEPASQRRAQIPAVARSNGLVDLAVSVRSLGDVRVGTTTYFKANVQAGWETPVVSIIGVLVFGVFALGIVRNIRRRLKARRAPVDTVAATEAE